MPNVIDARDNAIKNIINNLTSRYRTVSIREVLEEAEKLNIQKERTKEVIEKCYNNNEIVYPMKGFIERVKI